MKRQDTKHGRSERVGPTQRTLQTLAAFGLTCDDVLGGASRHAAALARGMAATIDGTLGVGEVAALTGPSGSGKSSVLRALARRVRRTGRVCIEVSTADLEHRSIAAGTVIDAVFLRRPGASLRQAMATLAAAGLADARIMVTRVGSLSEGERARLAVALAMGGLESVIGCGPHTLVIDEFGAHLDDISARATAAMLARWVARAGRAMPVRVAVATHRSAVIDGLRAQHVHQLPPAWLARGGADAASTRSRNEVTRAAG